MIRIFELILFLSLTVRISTLISNKSHLSMRKQEISKKWFRMSSNIDSGKSKDPLAGFVGGLGVAGIIL